MWSTIVPMVYIKSCSNPLYLQRHIYKYMYVYIYIYIYIYYMSYELHALRTSHTDTHRAYPRNSSLRTSHTQTRTNTQTHRAYPRTSCPTLRGLRNERAVLGPDCSAPGHTHTHTHTSRYFSTYATHTTHAIYINLHNLIYIYTYARPSLGFRV